MEYDNARVLVTDMKIEAIKDIIPLLEQVTRINQPLVIIAEDVTGAWHTRRCPGCCRLLVPETLL